MISLAPHALAAASAPPGRPCRTPGAARGAAPGRARRLAGAAPLALAAKRRSARRCSEESKVMQAGQTSGEVAEEAARAAGALIVERVGAEVLRSKAFESDLVTEVDQCCEEVIREIVQKHLPGHAFLGEESAGSSMESLLNTEGWLWVVDPLDGTTNFASGQPMSAVSICAARHGQPRAAAIYEPFRDELFTARSTRGAFLNGEIICVSGTPRLAEAVVASGCAPDPRSSAACFRAMAHLAPKTRTVRILGSAAINFAWLACGRLDGWFEVDLNCWDTAAGVLLVQEAGGIVTDCLGNDYTLKTRPVCASNGHIHFDLLEELADANVTGLDP
ncbi:unnamed protein product [Effrenium voratum]|uniref:Inositol-1-monophosphatase n=1 Tax=Effrenium voratum TaxID=2562239 RepID=A0AA36MJZ4_9DINO|nr:unnamed protein product [Effrenium voratum]